MGILRLLLALSVVAGHCGDIFGSIGVGGKMAVQLFFIISGFYMTFILKEKYIGKNSSYKLFITNRFLRIFILYWIALLASLLLYAMLGFVTQKWPGKFLPFLTIPTNIFTCFYVLFSSITLIGHDLMLFLGIDPNTGQLFFTPNFWNTEPPLHKVYLIPQAWSLSIEIMFYAIAPFLLNLRRDLIWVVAIGCLLLRFYMWNTLGLKNDPWTYRFFPTELLFFILGYFSYLIYEKIRSKIIDEKVYWLLIFISAISIFFYQKISDYQPDAVPFMIKEILFYLGFVMIIPLLFKFSRKLSWDNTLGELSYPVYIWHIFAQTAVGTMFSFLQFKTNFGGEIIATFTIVLSFLMVRFFVPPIEKYRQSRLA